ncbi:phage tail sheath family protein [Sporosarcina sp. FSL K6-5500]|uniref:phage tail sheath family protein n=1 Tax=Sporosarcina sp. FSL K6-5500 TaxID=2921558 RepID=UPI0030FA4D7B
MAYKHGVSTQEIPTSIVPSVSTSAGLPIVFGTAPVNLVENPLVNKPILCYRYGEAVQQLGYSDNFGDYTLCEFMSSHFSLFNVAPAVFINVLDPKIHKKPGVPATLTVTKQEALLKVHGVLPKTLVVKNSDGTTTYGEEDYETEFDDDGYLHIFTSVADEIAVEFEVIDPSMVDVTNIIGGVSVDGQYKGLELVNHVFPLFRLVPGLILAPKFSTDTGVAAVIGAKSNNINGLFKALGLVDIPTGVDGVTNYTNAAAYKNDNNIVSTHQAAFWPKVSLGGKQYHMSTQAAGVINRTDAANGDIPYVSPSNQNLQADSAVLEDGTEITLGQDQAAYLNGEGIVTALNFIGGWKLWGNRTAIYPGVTDPKDSFIPVRRMMNFIQNTLILTYWQKVDAPTNKKLIETVIDSINIWLNGMSARGQLLGGRVEFLESENPLASLIDGKVTFHVYATPPTPAREIEFLVEFDPSYFSTLFG